MPDPELASISTNCAHSRAGSAHSWTGEQGKGKSSMAMALTPPGQDRVNDRGPAWHRPLCKPLCCRGNAGLGRGNKGDALGEDGAQRGDKHREHRQRSSAPQVSPRAEHHFTPWPPGFWVTGTETFPLCWASGAGAARSISVPRASSTG